MLSCNHGSQIHVVYGVGEHRVLMRSVFFLLRGCQCREFQSERSLFGADGLEVKEAGWLGSGGDPRFRD